MHIKPLATSLMHIMLVSRGRTFVPAMPKAPLARSDFAATSVSAAQQHTDRNATCKEYKPSRLLDVLQERLGLANDGRLANALEIPTSSVSRMRNGKIPVYPALLIRMHEVSGLSIQELREIVGDRRSKVRCGVVFSKKKTAQSTYS